MKLLDEINNTDITDEENIKNINWNSNNLEFVKKKNILLTRKICKCINV